MKPKIQKRAAGPYHHGDLRAALIAAALRIIEEDGPEGLSLRGVAAAVGVSQTAPYHHFQDKAALLSAVAAAGFRKAQQIMIERAKAAETPLARLRWLAVGYVEFAVSFPQLFRLMEGPYDRNMAAELIEARAGGVKLLAETIAACSPGASNDEVRRACAAAWSLVHGFAVLCNDGRIGAFLDIADIRTAVWAITAHFSVSETQEAKGMAS